MSASDLPVMTSRIFLSLMLFSLVGACGGSGGGPGGGGTTPPSSDASLSDLTATAGALSPTFSPGVLAYTVGPAVIGGSTTVTATAANPAANIKINGATTLSAVPSAAISLPAGLTPVTILVTAADGVTQKTYTIVFQRAFAAQLAYVKASNTNAGDLFGFSVAVSGGTLVVGAPGEASVSTSQADNSQVDTGAVYVFVDVGGAWVQQAYLKASVTGVDRFGHSVAIDGDTLVVGAFVEDSVATGVNGNATDNTATDSGAAYVFVRSAGVWLQQAYLKASNTTAGDHFGHSVSVSGDTIVIGARREDSNASGVNGNQLDESATDAGAAYVFVRAAGVWSQQAYLKASSPDAGDEFGYAVAIDGDTIVVSAEYEDSNASGINGNSADDSLGESGAVYVFARVAGAWSQQAYIKASNPGGNDQFGYAVALSSGTLAVAARLEASSATGVGGNQADNGAAGSGAVYVYDRVGGTWSQSAYVKAANTGTGDEFGSSVALYGDTLIVGAILEDSAATTVNGNAADNSAADSGAAYVFLRTGGVWAQHSYLKMSNAEAGDWAGFAVAVHGGTVVVGSVAEDSNATGVGGNGGDNAAASSGAAYTFR